jgi:hypothetical protein
MTPCRCPACTDQPAPTYTEAHRHACEVAYVVGLPGRAERISYFALVRERRGAAAAKRLRGEAIAAWKAGQEVA